MFRLRLSRASWLKRIANRMIACNTGDNIMPKHTFRLVALSLALLATTIAVGVPAWPQQPSGSLIPNTVWVGADGKFEAEPDTVLVQFNISAQEEKLQDASQRADRAAEQVRQLLRTNGLDPKDAQISRFAVQPVYDYKNPKRKLVGYRVEANISIKLKDFSKVGPITQGLTDLDATDNQSLSYLLEDMDAAKIKAVEYALRRTHDEANAVARFSGRTLGGLSYASVDVREPIGIVQPMMKAMAAPMSTMNEAPPPPTADFGAQKITVNAHVNALYELK